MQSGGDELALLDATGQAELVRAREVTPVELVHAAIDRIEALDGHLNAVIHRRHDEASREAASLEHRGAPFLGVPILLKDIGAGGRLDGSPLHLGNRALRDARHVHRAGDSWLVRRLLRAGFVVVGKTNTPELGFSCTTEPLVYGATRNPWDTSRTPAGSSGGSAAAVAAGLVPVAHGSDGGGSIRMPASACGLVGLKVSRGRISAGPHAGEPGAGRAVEGCLTTTVRDTAAVLDVLAGPEPGDPVLAPPPARPYREEVGVEPGPQRVGVRTVGPAGMPLHPECVAAVRATARVLESLGHHVDEDAPRALDETEIGLDGILPLHASSTANAVDEVARMLGRDVEEADFEPATWEQAMRGRAYDAPQVVAASEAVVAWSRRMAMWWSGPPEGGSPARGHDLLLTPTLGTPVPRLGHLAWSAPEAPLRALEFNPICPVWNWTGQPAISLPVAQSSGGTPIGVMLVAAYGREDLLLRVAAQLEAAMPWRDRRPPVHAARPSPGAVRS